ncbi:MAG TPA: S9 family peptidase, partial [Ktedonobacteraceae bacterium]
GRSVIVRRTAEGHIEDLTPPLFNSRARVHEYGGGDYTVSLGTIYFSNFADQRVYRQFPGSEPQTITPAESMRYADGVIDRQRNRMVCVREDHTVVGREAVNTLVSLALDGSDQKVIISGNDFYSSPRLSPDGTRLAWLTWNHPNMPWDGTELWIGEFATDGSISHAEHIVGGANESIFQPEWSPEGILHYISDRTGWWNLYCWRNGNIIALCKKDAEFGLPQWGFGMSTYGFVNTHRIICSYTEQGAWRLASLDTTSGTLSPIETPYSTIRQVRVTDGQVLFIGGSPSEPVSIIQLDLNTSRMEVLRRSSKVTVDSGYLSIPQSIEFPTENGLTAYAFYYSPQNPDYVALPGERPPLLS